MNTKQKTVDLHAHNNTRIIVMRQRHRSRCHGRERFSGIVLHQQIVVATRDATPSSSSVSYQKYASGMSTNAMMATEMKPTYLKTPRASARAPPRSRSLVVDPRSGVPYHIVARPPRTPQDGS